MKIYLDNIIFSKVKNGGVSNYWYELIQYIETQDNVEKKYFESLNALENFHRKKLSIEKQVIDVKSNILKRFLPIPYKNNDKFIYHSSYYRGLSGSKNKIEVTTVYDFIHSFYSSFPKKQLHNVLKFNSIKRSKGVICISHNTYNDLNKICPLNTNQKAAVIHVGVSDDYFQINELTINEKEFINKNKLEDDFLLFIGGRTSYKNFDFVASVVNNSKKLKLVIVGGGLLSENEKKLFTEEAFNRLVFFTSLENNELNVLLNRASALFYPSSYEGFGIPVVEAMRAGCPVIGLNNATIREVAENSAILLDELSVSEFDSKIDQLKNQNFRTELIDRGLQDSKKYSWEKCSKETYEFYNSLYESF
jgi:glycosyltransferase involved in cell wall biosynthesis